MNDGRARQQRDRGGRPAEAPPLLGEGPRGLAHGQRRGLGSRHRQRVVKDGTKCRWDLSCVSVKEPLFSAEEIERGRRYHRPLYVALVVDLVLALAVAGRVRPGAAGARASVVARGAGDRRARGGGDGGGAAAGVVVARVRPRAPLGPLDADAAWLARRPGEGPRDRDRARGDGADGARRPCAMDGVVAARRGGRGRAARAPARVPRAGAARAGVQPLPAARGRRAARVAAGAVGAGRGTGAGRARRGRVPADAEGERVRLRDRAGRVGSSSTTRSSTRPTRRRSRS